MQLKFLNDRYAIVFSHKGFDICTLKNACPANGDSLGYVIDDERFDGQDFKLLDDAVKAIDIKSPNVALIRKSTAYSIGGNSKQKNGFIAEKMNFEGKEGFKVSQLRNGKPVCEQFVPAADYKSFCKEIKEIPRMIERNESLDCCL